MTVNLNQVIIFNLFADERLVENIRTRLELIRGAMVCSQFPDGETYIRVDTAVKDKHIIVVSSLDYPDQKILPLLFFVETVKSLGAKSVGLIAPYLAYMRQDARFQVGEGITSNYFAALLSRYFSWLITIDPHLHRHHSLSQIYTIPAHALHVRKLIAMWIKANVQNPLLIGPHIGSELWVSQIAKEIDAPHLIVDIDMSEFTHYKYQTPVMVDEIISTGRTVLRTVEKLSLLKMESPLVIGVHGLFIENAYENLLNSGIKQIITCNTIAHPSNQIDVSGLLAESVHRYGIFN